MLWTIDVHNHDKQTIVFPVFICLRSEVRACSNDQVEYTLQIVPAVVRDAYDASIVPERLHLHIRLQTLSKLLLDLSYCGIGDEPT